MAKYLVVRIFSLMQVAACKELADEFAEVVSSGKIGSVVEPMEPM